MAGTETVSERGRRRGKERGRVRVRASLEAFNPYSQFTCNREQKPQLNFSWFSAFSISIFMWFLPHFFRTIFIYIFSFWLCFVFNANFCHAFNLNFVAIVRYLSGSLLAINRFDNHIENICPTIFWLRYSCFCFFVWHSFHLMLLLIVDLFNSFIFQFWLFMRNH